MKPIIQQLKHLWRFISSKRRVQFSYLILLVILTSFAEVVGIGAVLPFLGVLTSPESVYEHQFAQSFIQALDITSADELLLPVTIVFVLAAIIAGVMRLLLLWATMKLTYSVGTELSVNIYRRTLYQPYATHLQRNSSEVINAIANKVNGTISIIMMSLNFISAIFIIITILVALLYIDTKSALFSFFGFGLIYGIVILFTRKRLSCDSQHIANKSTDLIKSLQEGLGGIRDILIEGSQEFYCNIYRRADVPLRRAQASINFIGASPRYLMETAGMLVIAVLAYTLSQRSDNFTEVVPFLGALALGAQRLLPMLQQSYVAWTSIKGGQVSLHDTLMLLDQKLPHDYAEQDVIKPLPFNKKIIFKNLSFKYGPDTPYVLKNINLSIVKGSCVGFIGKTGSGKSTLIDIIMGLLEPTEGMIEVDGKSYATSNYRAWQSNIAHVPQVIFLADCSIEENIAFGVSKDKINHERVQWAARIAQIANFIEDLPQKYQSSVGERGSRLSGGQRQRIGIARALYKQASVIIFDEATSALDNEVEKAVMQSIDNLSDDITIFIVAHRLTTLKNCSLIVELSDCGIKRTGKYCDIIAE